MGVLLSVLCLIQALSVSVNCWSLVRVCLMTLSLTGNPAIINLYGTRLICPVWMVDDVSPLSVLCKLRRALLLLS